MWRRQGGLLASPGQCQFVQRCAVRRSAGGSGLAAALLLGDAHHACTPAASSSHMLHTLGRKGNRPRRCGSSGNRHTSKRWHHRSDAAHQHREQCYNSKHLQKDWVQKAATARHSKAPLPLLGAELCSRSDSFVQVRGCSLLGAPLSCQAGNGGIQPSLYLGGRVRAGCRLQCGRKGWAGVARGGQRSEAVGHEVDGQHTSSS